MLRLVKGTLEWIIEDVGWVLDGAREAVGSELVLEFEGVGGVVGIGDLATDVGDDDGEGTAARLDDVGVRREE